MIDNNQNKYIAVNGRKITNNKIVKEYQEIYSNCCTALFEYPGWPDSDICSECLEHADIWDDEEEDWDDDEFCRHTHTTGGRCLDCGFDTIGE